VAPPPAPAPVVVPKIVIATHPELDCGTSSVPTGFPPPKGLEGWCVSITEDGRVVQDGPYIRWHDPDHIAERGEFSDDHRSGTWTQYDPTGALLAHGNYSEGFKEGLWRTFYPSGQPHTEGRYEHGQETGQWVIWGEDGTTSVVGEYWNGLRTGTWWDYQGTVPVRERFYRDGIMTLDDRK
jgi:hypothetical protein